MIKIYYIVRSYLHISRIAFVLSKYKYQKGLCRQWRYCLVLTMNRFCKLPQSFQCWRLFRCNSPTSPFHSPKKKSLGVQIFSKNIMSQKLFDDLLESIITFFETLTKEVSLHKKWSFPLEISSANLTKSAVSCNVFMTISKTL